MNRSASNENSDRRIALTVRCRGETGWLNAEPNGDVCFEGINSTTATKSAIPCLGKSLPVKLFPLKEVIGASLQGSSGVRIWHCTPSSSGAGPTARVKQTLRKSDVFECSTTAEARQLVATLQSSASWGGQASAPRIVAVVNPVSGQGRSRGIFMDTVLPLLRDVAGLSVEVHTTTHKAHATQIVRGLDLSQVSLLLYVGGDGTVFEGMQGLMSRPDWCTAVKVPFGTVPTGSGNGLAASLGMWDPVTAAHAVCKRRTNPLDMASVLQPPSSRFYLLLSVAYGLMANLDIGTEHLRWMGEPRFTVGGVRELLSGRAYPLRAALWTGERDPSLRGHGSMALSHTADQPFPPKICLPSPPSTALPEDPMRQALLGADSSNSQDQQSLAPQPIALLSPVLQGGAREGNAGVQGTGGDAGVHTNGEGGADGVVLGSYPAGPPLPILSRFAGSGLPSRLPSHTEELPAGWHMLPEQVGSRATYFMLQNTTHLALNAPLNPRAHLSDGYWELMYLVGMEGWEGKKRGTQLLLSTETGEHVNFDFVKTDKVRAMILEPLAGDSTWMVLDGEQVPRDQPLYVEIHPQLCTALVAPGWTGLPT